MSSREFRLADAAVHVVAHEGTRGLTHRAVDARAGLTFGSTSNVFRTRAALIDGVLAHLIQREQAVLDALPFSPASKPTPPLLLQLGAAMIDDALGPGRTYTLARRALFVEATRYPQIGKQLRVASQYWWDLSAGLLARLNVPDAEHRGRWLLAYIDGLISDQLARPDPDFDARDALGPAIFGILTQP